MTCPLPSKNSIRLLTGSAIKLLNASFVMPRPETTNCVTSTFAPLSNIIPAGLIMKIRIPGSLNRSPPNFVMSPETLFSTAELVREPGCEKARVSRSLKAPPAVSRLSQLIIVRLVSTVTCVVLLYVPCRYSIEAEPPPVGPMSTRPPAGPAITAGSDVFKNRQHVRKYVITFLQ